MQKEKLPPRLPVRKPRADAERNRERILEVAKEVFTRDGAAASLDDIARRSGIGNATLEDGSAVKCFICEPYAIAAATEITHFGGWLKYLADPRKGML